MKNIEISLSALKTRERELETLSEMIDKEGLTQCIRLLSTYLALYKKDFGDLSAERYQAIIESTAVEPEMVGVIENGVNEAVAMMCMIINMRKLQDKDQLAVTIN